VPIGVSSLAGACCDEECAWDASVTCDKVGACGSVGACDDPELENKKVSWYLVRNLLHLVNHLDKRYTKERLVPCAWFIRRAASLSMHASSTSYDVRSSMFPTIALMPQVGQTPVGPRTG